MVNFEYLVPTKVVFGKDAELRVGALAKEAGASRVLVHFGGSSAKRSGLLDRVEQSLSEAGVGYVELGGVVPNPRLSLAKEGLELAKKEGVDFVLAVGGGSVIDSAKAIAYGMANDFALEDLFLGREKTDKIAPLGAIVTLAGAGSETSNSAVLDIDTLEGPVLKRSYNHECSRPIFAIMNPELTYTLSPYQTAAPGADIMMHTMERYFTQERDTDLTDAIAEGLLRVVKDAVVKAIHEPSNYGARANLLWAGSLSHCGLTGAGCVSDFACHAIEHELGALYDVAHGAGLAAIWGSWARYVIDAGPERFAKFGVNVFGVADDHENPRAVGIAGIEAWEAWCREIGMPTSLSELGVDPTAEQIRTMAAGAVEARGGDHAGSFVKLREADIEAILESAR